MKLHTINKRQISRWIVFSLWVIAVLFDIPKTCRSFFAFEGAPLVEKVFLLPFEMIIIACGLALKPSKNQNIVLSAGLLSGIVRRFVRGDIGSWRIGFFEDSVVLRFITIQSMILVSASFLIVCLLKNKRGIVSLIGACILVFSQIYPFVFFYFGTAYYWAFFYNIMWIPHPFMMLSSVFASLSILSFFFLRSDFLTKIKMNRFFLDTADSSPEKKLEKLNENFINGNFDQETYEKVRQEIIKSL